jgi:hypothetical protein
VVFGPQQPIDGLENLWIFDGIFLGALQDRKIFTQLNYSVCFNPCLVKDAPLKRAPLF